MYIKKVLFQEKLKKCTNLTPEIFVFIMKGYIINQKHPYQMSLENLGYYKTYYCKKYNNMLF
jgi:hypothetical protein